jgi:hypothetical protein
MFRQAEIAHYRDVDLRDMKTWARDLRVCPYPGGAALYTVLIFLADLSIWIAAFVVPIMLWMEWHVKKSKGQNVS